MNVRRLILHLFLMLVVVVPSAIFAGMTTAAADGPPPIDGGTGGTPPGSGGGGNNGGGGGGSGSGGSGGGLGNSAAWSTTATYWTPFSGMPRTLRGSGFDDFSEGVVVRYAGQCDGMEGCVTRQSGRTRFVDGQQRRTQLAASYTGLPFPRFVIQSRFCAFTVNLTANGPHANPVIPAKYVDLGLTYAPFAAGGYRDLNLCAGPYTSSSSYNAKDYGQYYGRGQGRALQCSVKVYTSISYRTGSIPPSELLGCNPNVTRPVTDRTVAWTISCGGLEIGTHNRDFTGNACLGGPPSVNWTCGTNHLAPPILNGTSNNAITQVFHDGRKNSLSWGVPNVSGNVSGVRDKKTSLQYVSGTPFRAGQAQSAPSQHFKASPHAFGANVANWNAGSSDPNRAAWDVQWFKAGMPGPLTGGADANIFRAQSIFRFTAEFATYEMIITGINFTTGQVFYSQRLSNTTSVGTCPSSTTLVEVLRARNDN